MLIRVENRGRKKQTRAIPRIDAKVDDLEHRANRAALQKAEDHQKGGLVQRRLPGGRHQNHCQNRPNRAEQTTWSSQEMNEYVE